MNEQPFEAMSVEEQRVRRKVAVFLGFRNHGPWSAAERALIEELAAQGLQFQLTDEIRARASALPPEPDAVTG